jgi:DNA-binding NarL/FixJ family response regulator
MDTSSASAFSAQALGLSFPAVSYESRIALANNAKGSEGLQHSGARLSTRERTIVLLMGHGLSNKRIARQLSIAPETVKSHAKRIFWKLTVQTRAQAVYRASTLGLLSVETDQIVARPLLRAASVRKPIGLTLQGGSS